MGLATCHPGSDCCCMLACQLILAGTFAAPLVSTVLAGPDDLSSIGWLRCSTRRSWLSPPITFCWINGCGPPCIGRGGNGITLPLLADCPIGEAPGAPTTGILFGGVGRAPGTPAIGALFGDVEGKCCVGCSLIASNDAGLIVSATCHGPGSASLSITSDN